MTEIKSVVSAERPKKNESDISDVIRRLRDAAWDAESAAGRLEDAAADVTAALDGAEGKAPKPEDEVFEVAVQRLHQQAHRESNDAYHWRSCLKPGCHDLATNELSPRAVA